MREFQSRLRTVHNPLDLLSIFLVDDEVSDYSFQPAMTAVDVTTAQTLLTGLAHTSAKNHLLTLRSGQSSQGDQLMSTRSAPELQMVVANIAHQTGFGAAAVRVRSAGPAEARQRTARTHKHTSSTQIKTPADVNINNVKKRSVPLFDDNDHSDEEDDTEAAMNREVDDYHHQGHDDQLWEGGSALELLGRCNSPGHWVGQ